ASSVKLPGKKGQASQNHALVFGEEIVAPVERRAQRLLARQRRAGTASQQPEAVTQARTDLLDRQRPDAHRGHTQPERNPVEMYAKLGDDRGTRSSQAEVGLLPPRALDE